MKLLTKKLLKQLRPLRARENDPDPMVLCKFFYPDFHWAWYAIEYDPKNEVFFGVVDGEFAEIGYFSLQRLISHHGKLGLPVERDRYFKPCRLSDLKARLRAPVQF